jgi:hypothetical protein
VGRRVEARKARRSSSRATLWHRAWGREGCVEAAGRGSDERQARRAGALRRERFLVGDGRRGGAGATRRRCGGRGVDVGLADALRLRCDLLEMRAHDAIPALAVEVC